MCIGEEGYWVPLSHMYYRQMSPWERALMTQIPRKQHIGLAGHLALREARVTVAGELQLV